MLRQICSEFQKNKTAAVSMFTEFAKDCELIFMWLSIKMALVITF
jgi:hypothetical protein